MPPDKGLQDEGTRKGCPNRALNAERCSCEVRDCARRGLCCECIAFHRLLGESPACIKALARPGAEPAPASAVEPSTPRGDAIRIIDFASCAG